MAVRAEEEEEAVDRAFERAPHAFPLRPAKVQRPRLPEETLHRARLLDWLEAKAHRRVVYIVAEAGFGKTTLLADFAQRTQSRTFWYRLDEDDTDGLVFLRYLVAACQAVDPRLAQRSASLLTESVSGPASQGEILETLIAELEAFADVPSILILDDYHAVEGNASIREVVERLIARAPDRITFVLASRRTPDLAAGALRARDELAELGREDLRFHQAETDRLFRDSYRQPLESDVLDTLQARTDGWAASLQLVRTAVGGRTPAQVRSFVQSLSGAEGSLYEYLAEEVVGELEPGLRAFLARVAVLEDVEPETAAVAAGVSPAQARQLLGQAQRLGLMARGGGDGPTWRAHPLVREYMLARLVTEIGEDGLAELHRHLAELIEPRSWRLAARHWAAAGEADQVRRVICEATSTIIGTGDLSAAEELIAEYPDPNPNPWFDLLHARSLLAAGRHKEGLELTNAAGALVNEGSCDTHLSDVHALGAMRIGIELDDARMRRAGTSRLARSMDPELVMIGRASEALCEAAEGVSLDIAARVLSDLCQLNRARKHVRYEAITLLNLCVIDRLHGNPARAAEDGRAAVSLLLCGENGPDLAAARVNLARALADLGESREALDLMQLASAGEWKFPQVAADIAEMNAIYGDPGQSSPLIAAAMAGAAETGGEPYCMAAASRIALVHGQLPRAMALLAGAEGPSFVPGFRASRLLLEAQIRAVDNPSDPALAAFLENALSLAERQQAWFHCKTLRLTRALVSEAINLSSHVGSLVAVEDRAHLSISAELVVRRLGDMDSQAFAVVQAEAALRPERWRWATRHLLDDPEARPADVRRAAEILDAIGTQEDIARLRVLAHGKALGSPEAGRDLIRRLAPRAFVDDLGRLEVRVGDRVVLSSEIRRKVVSLLAFLLTRPQFTASREQVMDALWPEMDPMQAANSLNQTAYFLRRVFEPNCDDDTTAGYLRARGDLIWLDSDLVSSRSSECLGLIAAMRNDRSPELAVKLAESYSGRFAVDFLYDDWSASFRDTLHASYLDRVEKAIQRDMTCGAFDRAITIAQHAIAADPDAEQIELALLRLYRLTGAHAAAAEQYTHYATMMREQFGVEPPPLESL